MKNLLQIYKQNIFMICIAALTILAGFILFTSNVLANSTDAEVTESAVVEKVESAVIEVEKFNPCISTKSSLGDSAFWATTAVRHFAERRYAEAIKTVDSCFKQWGPRAGQEQKIIHDTDKECPPTGKVSTKAKVEIEQNYLMNDVSTALWAKARSQHKLNLIEQAKQSYSQCIYMTCGRTWDPKGWYWSPAEDCAKHVQKLL